MQPIRNAPRSALSNLPPGAVKVVKLRIARRDIAQLEERAVWGGEAGGSSPLIPIVVSRVTLGNRCGWRVR